MVSSTAIFVFAVISLGTAIFLFSLKHPFYYYIPGFVASIIEPSVIYQEVKWRTHEEDIDASAADVPNVVFIIADDLGYNDLSLGSAGVRTPNIDSIAINGANFQLAYAGHATCSPSRAAIFTGRFPSRIGFDNTAIPKIFSWVFSRPNKKSAVQSIFHADKNNQVPAVSKMILPVSEILIPQVLKSSNYSTGYIGKLFNNLIYFCMLTM